MKILALLMLTTCALGDVATLAPVKDNTLYFSFVGTPLSNAKGEHAFIGSNASAEPRRFPLAFDLSSIPPGSTITGATLRLTMSKTVVGAKPATIHRLVRDWGEGASNAPLEEGSGAPAEPGDCTWKHAFFPDDPWTAEGGDFIAAPSAATSISTIGIYHIASPGMIADAQHWLDHPTDNFGWVLIGDETVGGTSKRFDTREHVATANRPSLTIEFEPPCAPDCEGDGDLDVFDFLCFQGFFAVMDPYADFEGDGDWDIFDFLAFQNAYAEGCE